MVWYTRVEGLGCTQTRLQQGSKTTIAPTHKNSTQQHHNGMGLLAPTIIVILCMLAITPATQSTLLKTTSQADINNNPAATSIAAKWTKQQVKGDVRTISGATYSHVVDRKTKDSSTVSTRGFASGNDVKLDLLGKTALKPLDATAAVFADAKSDEGPSLADATLDVKVIKSGVLVKHTTPSTAG